MGIPHLFKHLATAHPSAVRAYPSAHRHSCDRLYLDFNSVIHNCARNVMMGAHDERTQDEKTQDERTQDPVGDAVIMATVEHLKCLVWRMRPRSLVYVAIDGTPPRAKMNQQRFRRYMTTMRRPPSSWDTNAITPGTAFMERLTMALATYAKTAGVKTCVSGAEDAGEGEQKIFNHMRDSITMSPDVIVYGLDADLLLMSMLYPRREGLRVVREQDASTDGVLQVVDIGRLSKCVVVAFVGDTATTKKEDNAVLREFVALCILLGNDFIPGLPGMRIRDGALHDLVRVYRQVVVGDGASLAAGGAESMGGINVNVLASMLGALARTEDATLVKADRAFYERVQFVQRRPPTKNIDDFYPAMHPPLRMVRPDVEGCGWRPRYYRHIMGIADAPAVKSACLSYLAGIGWTLRYMEQKCMSKGWHYPHLYAPTAHDLVCLLAEPGVPAVVDAMFDASDRAFFGPPIPGWELLMVLPPSSAALLRSDELRAIMTDEDGEAAYMFPTRFNVATYLRDKLWECQPMLPSIDIALIRDIICMT